MAKSSQKIKESDMFPLLKTYLEGQGYSVHAEVKNCDIAARKGDDLVLVEMKTSLSLALISQAVERKEITDAVYIAVPVPPGKQLPPNFRRIKSVLRRLEIGCILLDFMKTKERVRIELHPLPYAPRRRHNRRRAILREIDGRYAEFNRGGEPSGTEKITAYKQEALRIARLLSHHGACSPKKIRSLGGSEKTQTILSRNVYGWFDKIDRGLYCLDSSGEEALTLYSEILRKI